jgi:hypothetical protein
VQNEIDRAQWKSFLDEFSRRNQLRPTRLEIIGRDLGAQNEETMLPFAGISYETKGSETGSVEIMLGGETSADSRNLTHAISGVKRIIPLPGAEALEDGLEIEGEDGVKALLRFVALREIPASA